MLTCTAKQAESLLYKKRKKKGNERCVGSKAISDESA